MILIKYTPGSTKCPNCGQVFDMRGLGYCPNCHHPYKTGNRENVTTTSKSTEKCK